MFLSKKDVPFLFTPRLAELSMNITEVDSFLLDTQFELFSIIGPEHIKTKHMIISVRTRIRSHCIIRNFFIDSPSSALIC